MTMPSKNISIICYHVETTIKINTQKSTTKQILKPAPSVKKRSWENAVILWFLVTHPGSWKSTFEKFCWRKALHLFL